MKNVFTLLIIILFFSCQSNSGKETESGQLVDSTIQSGTIKPETLQSETIPANETVPETNDEFSEFLLQFEKAELPISITSRSVDTKSLKNFKYTNFKKTRGERSFADWWAYKQINTNGQYQALITLEYNSINNLVPILETYTTTGQLIDRKVLDFGWEEYIDYKDSVALNKDFTIYVSGIAEKVELDENENEIPGSLTRKLYYRKGKLLNTGKIELSGQFDKLLEK